MSNLVYVDSAVVNSPLALPRLSTRHGGHWTDKAGGSKHGQTVAILYGADGGAETADVTAELEAILAVGQALARLQNPAGRRRVLNWAVERFDATDETAVAAVAPPSDPMLAVDDLADLFESPHPAAVRASDALDDHLFNLPAVGLLAAPPDEEISYEPRHEPRIRVLISCFVNAVRRLALGAGSPETAV